MQHIWELGNLSSNGETITTFLVTSYRELSGDAVIELASHLFDLCDSENTSVRLLTEDEINEHDVYEKVYSLDVQVFDLFDLLNNLTD